MAENTESNDLFGILEGQAPASNYEPSNRDKDLVKALQERFDAAAEARVPYERNWELYRLYLKGDQLVVHRSTGELVRLAPEDNRRLRSVNNVLRPTSRSLVGKLTRTIPTCRIIPATNDFDDVHSAIVADALVQFIRRKEDLDLIYQQMNEYLPWAGNGIAQLLWDRTAGQCKAWCPVCGFEAERTMVGTPCPRCTDQRNQELALQQQQTEQLQEINDAVAVAESPLGMPLEAVPPGQPAAPPDLEQLGPLSPEQEPPPLAEIKTGDIKVHVRDIRDIYVSPGATSFRDASWICWRPTLSVSQVRMMFPEMAAFLKAEPARGDRNSEIRNEGELYGEQHDDSQLHLYEFHEMPTEAYPYGRIVWMANDIILREIESPYWEENGRFPFFHFGWDVNPGELWFEPYISQAWHRQREINNNETAIREHTELLLKPKWLIPMGSRVTADEFTATSAQTILYNPAVGAEPHPTQVPAVPPSIWERTDRLVNDVRQQATVTDADAGITQSDPNGRAMAIINAESDQQLGPVRRRNGCEWRDLHKMIISVAKKFYSPDRILNISGPDGTEVYHFADMNLAPGYDLIIEDQDGMSTNSAVRFQQAMDLLQAGYFIDPQTGTMDKQGFARHARLNFLERGYDIEATERSTAAAIPEKLKAGGQFTPQYEDDAKLFAETLLGWLRGPGRKEDPYLTQQVRQIWMYYVQYLMTAQFQPAQFGGEQGSGGPSQPGTDQSAPGGSANNAGHIGANQQGLGGEAQGAVGQADRAGESAARTQSKHEG